MRGEDGWGRGEAHLNDRDSLLRVVVTVEFEERVLVRREEGEERTSVSATDLDDALRSGLIR